jgi:hypothetical protein
MNAFEVSSWMRCWSLRPAQLFLCSGDLLLLCPLGVPILLFGETQISAVLCWQGPTRKSLRL